MKIVSFSFLALLAFVAGCDSEGTVRPEPTNIRVFDAASNFETILFLREESVVAQMDYGQGAQTAFDSGPYDFSIDYSQVGERAPVRGLTFSETLSPDRIYTFVAVAPGGVFRVIESSVELRDAASNQARWTMVHAHPSLGAIDVYVEAPGTLLSNAVSRGSIGFEDSVTFEFSAGTYRIWLTTAGNPNDVVFESQDLMPPSGSDESLVISDPDGLGLTEIAVSPISQSSALVQSGLTSGLRVINAIDDRLDRDFYVDETTATAVFESQPFGVVSDYAEVAGGGHDLIMTPAGNPGTEEDSTLYLATAGRLYTALVAGDTTGGVATIVLQEDKRGISNQATVRVFNGAGIFAGLNLYFAAPGTDITTIAPSLQMLAPDVTARLPLAPANVEVTVQDPVTSTVVAGPEIFTFEDGGFYGMLLVNGADGNTVDFVLFDDFIP